MALSARVLHVARHVAAIGIVLLAAILIWVVVYLDRQFAISAFRGPFYLATLVPLAAGSLVAWLLSRSRWYLSPFVIMIVLIAPLSFLDNSPRKPFLRAYQSIAVGMTLGEIEDTLADLFPTEGPYPAPLAIHEDSQTIKYVLDPEDERYNAEYLIVYVNDGRCTGVEYVPD